MVILFSFYTYSEDLSKSNSSNSQEDIKALSIINATLKNKETLSSAKVKSLRFEKLNIFRRLNIFDDEKKLLNKLKSLYPEILGIYRYEGWMYMGENDFKNTIKSYEYYLANIPLNEKYKDDIKSIKDNLLFCYNAEGQWEKALTLSRTIKKLREKAEGIEKKK